MTLYPKQSEPTQSFKQGEEIPPRQSVGDMMKSAAPYEMKSKSMPRQAENSQKLPKDQQGLAEPSSAACLVEPDSGKKQLSCDVCGKVCSTPSALKKHKIIHTD